MSRILEEMLAKRRLEESQLSKDNFYIEKKGDITVVMLKTSEEEEREKLFEQRVLSENNLVVKRFEKSDDGETCEEVIIDLAYRSDVKLTKSGKPDKRYKNNK